MRWVLGSLLVLLSSVAWGTPRVFAPVYLNPGAVHELYAWSEERVEGFRVEVTRSDGPKKLVAQGFPVGLPLAVLGVGNRPVRWASALLAVDSLEAPGPVLIRFLGTDGTVWGEVSSEIRPRSFPKEEIVLDQAMSDLRNKPNRRRDKEAAEIGKLYQTFDPTFAWGGGRFQLPVPVAPSSAQFGDIRDYRYADGTTARDTHRGVDFAVPVGTKVSAPAAGKVVLVADRYLTGTTVVLEHAPGVYSVYFHLSRALVKKGQSVKQGDEIARSGASGLVTGPHLHWEVRVSAVPVNPLDLVVDGLLDTATVSAVISSIERPIH